MLFQSMSVIFGLEIETNGEKLHSKSKRMTTKLLIGIMYVSKVLDQDGVEIEFGFDGVLKIKL